MCLIEEAERSLKYVMTEATIKELARGIERQFTRYTHISHTCSSHRSSQPFSLQVSLSATLLSLVSLTYLTMHILKIETSLHTEDICKGSKIVTSTQFIGADKNVKLEHITCDVIADEAAIQHGALLQSRQAPADVCGDTCRLLNHRSTSDLEM